MAKEHLLNCVKKEIGVFGEYIFFGIYFSLGFCFCFRFSFKPIRSLQYLQANILFLYFSKYIYVYIFNNCWLLFTDLFLLIDFSLSLGQNFLCWYVCLYMILCLRCEHLKDHQSSLGRSTVIACACVYATHIHSPTTHIHMYNKLTKCELTNTYKHIYRLSHIVY